LQKTLLREGMAVNLLQAVTISKKLKTISMSFSGLEQVCVINNTFPRQKQ
jgi:hypothetical protein